jgi:hypothetical protein
LWLSLCLAFAPAQQPAPAPPAHAKLYQRLARQIAPDGVGRPDRLDAYLQLFRRELVNDPRLFAFEVQAVYTDRQQVSLSGWVGYREHISALVDFLHCLGFEVLAEGVEVLPSVSLGENRYGIIQTSHALSYEAPDAAREVVTDCLLGAPLFVLRECPGGFFFCQGMEGYLGYVRQEAIRRLNATEFARHCRGAVVVLRRDQRTDGGDWLPMGSRLLFREQRGEEIVAQLPGGDDVALPSESCEIFDGTPDARLLRVIDHARSLVGSKYLWGGTTREGVDCSGLVQSSFAAAGVNLPRDANQQMYLGRLTATRENRDGLRPGDTLYFLNSAGRVSHTAIYIGQDRYLEAVRPVVRYTSFHPQDDAYDARRAAAFCFAKRIFE